jgi:hypothetical protein
MRQREDNTYQELRERYVFSLTQCLLVDKNVELISTRVQARIVRLWMGITCARERGGGGGGARCGERTSKSGIGGLLCVRDGDVSDRIYVYFI